VQILHIWHQEREAGSEHLKPPAVRVVEVGGGVWWRDTLDSRREAREECQEQVWTQTEMLFFTGHTL